MTRHPAHAFERIAVFLRDVKFNSKCMKARAACSKGGSIDAHTIANPSTLRN
jgi:hypothetical protein